MNVGAPRTLAHSWLLLIHQLPAKPAYLRVKIWRRLQDLGLVDMIHPEKLTSDLLSEHVLQILSEPTAASTQIAWTSLDSDGLPRISRFVAAEVRARSMP